MAQVQSGGGCPSPTHSLTHSPLQTSVSDEDSGHPAAEEGNASPCSFRGRHQTCQCGSANLPPSKNEEWGQQDGSKQVEALVAKPDNPSPGPGRQSQERTDSHELSSDLQVCAGHLCRSTELSVFNFSGDGCGKDLGQSAPRGDAVSAALAAGIQH